MKKIFVTLMIAVSALSMMASNVEAKRLGSGSSIGRQSTNVTRQAPTQSSQSTNTATNAAKPAVAPSPTPSPTPAAPAPSSPWKGVLGGALLGLGAGALLSHFGMGGAMGGMLGSILMIALLAFVVMFIVRLFRGRSDGGYTPVYDGGYSTASSSTSTIGSRIEPTVQPTSLKSLPLAGEARMAQWSVPTDFDVPAFLRNAKTYFIRLQASWDKADIKDIREFTTPEMFAELKMQLQERGASPNVTDVVTLGAELMGVEVVNDDYLASVKFSGMIKESETAEAAPFEEVWNMSKPTSGQGGWVLAGIQQLT
ncbi:MAG TPA: Tim44-like domain-containing protein [Burkholderiaceae bacterium]|jgi:predicted lipid-binding transport protein (Tim44 family)